MFHFLILAQDATLMPSLQTVTGKSWAKSPPGSSFRPSWANGWGRWHKRRDVTSVCKPGKAARLCVLCVFRLPAGTRSKGWTVDVFFPQRREWELRETSVRYLWRDLQRRPYVHPEQPEIQRSAREHPEAQVNQRLTARELRAPTKTFTNTNVTFQV